MASAAVTGVCSVVAAVVAVRWKDRPNTNSAESSAARIVAEQQLAALKLPGVAKSGEGSAAADVLADKPFDTRISAEVLNGCLVLKTPPTFENMVSLLIGMLFAIVWCGFIFIAAMILLVQIFPVSGVQVDAQPNSFMQGFEVLFLVVWICGATYGLSRMIRSLVGEIVTIVGGRTLMLSQDTLIVHSGALGLSRNQVYLLKYIRRLREEKNATTSRDNQGAIVFEYGRRKITVGGFTEVEARWARDLMQGAQPATTIFALPAQSG